MMRALVGRRVDRSHGPAATAGGAPCQSD